MGRTIIGSVGVLFIVIIGLTIWWGVDRPFGGATCWVNFRADTYEQALELETALRERGLDANAPPLKYGKPPANPVVAVKGGFWRTESSLEAETKQAWREVGAGEFDQCRVPSLGD